MFVALSKTLDLLFEPLTLALVLGALALAFRRHPRKVAALVGAGLAVLVLFSSPLVASRLAGWVEEGAERSYAAEATYDAAIVLGGGLDAELTQLTGQPQFNGAAERFLTAFTLWREGRVRHLVLSGGNVFPKEGVPPESELLARLLQSWGVPSERMVIEAESRNTWENAVKAVPLVKERGWRKLVLVTSAAHMVRAEGCFRAAGLEVDTLPVDYRAPRMAALSLWPRAGALALSTESLRELAGRYVYRWKGYARPD